MKNIFLFLILINLSCSNSVKDKFLYQKVQIEQVSSYHVGGGRYKTVGVYKYIYQNIEYTGSVESSKGRSFSKDKIEKGDSILIKINTKNPKKNEFIKFTYRNSWIEVK